MTSTQPPPRPRWLRPAGGMSSTTPTPRPAKPSTNNASSPSCNCTSAAAELDLSSASKCSPRSLRGPPSPSATPSPCATSIPSSRGPSLPGHLLPHPGHGDRRLRQCHPAERARQCPAPRPADGRHRLLRRARGPGHHRRHRLGPGHAATPRRRILADPVHERRDLPDVQIPRRALGSRPDGGSCWSSSGAPPRAAPSPGPCSPHRYG